MAESKGGRRAGLVEPLRDPGLRAIWTSLLASSVGDWAARLALSILVLHRTGSAALSALVLAVSFLPWVGPGQFVAARIGHLRRVPVMVTADLARAVLYAVLLIRLPVIAILLVALLAAFATPAFETARSALTVEVVPESLYGRAIALLDMTDQSAIVLGYLLGGIVVAAGGYRIGLAVDVASYLLSASVVARVKEARRAGAPEAAASQLRRGLGVIRNDPVIRRGLGIVVVAGIGVASIEATAAAYARIVLHAGPAVAGQLAAAVPLGVIAAIPFLPKAGSSTRLLRAAGVVQVVGGGVATVAFSSGHLAGALVGFFGAGVLTGSVTPAQVAFQPRIPGADRPAVFGVIQGAAVGVQGGAAALGGLLASVIGPRPGALVWSAAVVLLGLTVLLLPAVAGDVGTDPHPEAGAGEDTAGSPGPPTGPA